MIHLDLFSGIGGFAYAVDQVWPGAEHIFCEINPFCQQVIKKHWGGSKIYGDIRELIADTDGNRLQEQRSKFKAGGDRQFSETIVNAQGRQSRKPSERQGWEDIGGSGCDILTGGFPCQPFSCAGKRKGTNDNRHLWPEMLRVIQDFKPTWVIAENVRGILTIEQGVVFEQVCLDLEREGYEVQPLIIPAVSVNAPHRRDRVWFVANHSNTRTKRVCRRKNATADSADLSSKGLEGRNVESEGHQRHLEDNTNTTGQGLERRSEEGKGFDSLSCGEQCDERRSWNQNWLEVATELCGMANGLSTKLDGFELSKSAHRRERIKALGNAIVPQVAMQIFHAIKEVYQ